MIFRDRIDAAQRLGKALAKYRGKNPLVLDSRPPSIPLSDYIYNETRYRMLTQSDPDEAKRLLKLAQQDIASHWQQYEKLAADGLANGHPAGSASDNGKSEP